MKWSELISSKVILIELAQIISDEKISSVTFEDDVIAGAIIPHELIRLKLNREILKRSSFKLK